jgi:hypothetical protein
MHKLLKLSNIAINVSHISRIYLSKDKYTIHLVEFNIGGGIIYGSGAITSSPTVVEIKKDNHPDYFKMSEYILNHSI